MPSAPAPLTGTDWALVSKALENHAEHIERLYHSVTPRQPSWMVEARASRRLANRIRKGAR